MIKYQYKMELMGQKKRMYVKSMLSLFFIFVSTEKFELEYCEVNGDQKWVINNIQR